MIKLRR